MVHIICMITVLASAVLPSEISLDSFFYASKQLIICYFFTSVYVIPCHIDHNSWIILLIFVFLF
ncbi:hypothetical protein E1A91_D10G177600v1 [Gossypium mustelinum]|uniref:NADH:quinone oxidoreductase/Mrp antiporter membrane subunit domain-containing protein n=1 Tax=Gossypium mustelinum TaxID=34275 RepID=A0A5D2T876_GOSMU|nr:hypothetical protein E1A91_D10G177600v1 [Gossypium mustelinum]